MKWDIKTNEVGVILSDEEKKLLRLLVTDMTALEISEEMQQNYFHIQHSIARLTNLFKVRGRVGLVRTAFKLKIITANEL